MSLARASANKILLCLCLIGCLTVPAYAQKKNINGAEKAVLAFYKLSGVTPDFEKWINTNFKNKYGHNPPPPELFEQEKLRLQYGLGMYDPEREILKINTTVISQFITKGNKTYLASIFQGENAMETPYFPYNAGHVWVAVLINDLEDYLLLELDEEQQKKISALLPAHNKPYNIELTLYFRPVSAQPEPMQIDGLEQHIMLGEIAYIGFKKPGLTWQEDDGLLWEYYAPWYMGTEKQDLLDILESR